MNGYSFEDDGHVWASCCGSSECEQCGGTGQAQLTGHDAVLGALAMLGEVDVWPALMAEAEAQTREAMAGVGRLRRRLQQLAQDALNTCNHLERHFPGVGGLPSVQQTKRRAERALGRGNIVATEDPCVRVASEVS